MIAVIDYKAGNLTSVVKALRHLLSEMRGADDVVVTQAPEEVLRADKIVLPGVGHFQSTQLLADLGLTEATRAAVAKGTPFPGDLCWVAVVVCRVDRGAGDGGAGALCGAV